MVMLLTAALDKTNSLCYHRTQQTLTNDNDHHRDDTMIVHDNQFFDNADYD